MQAMALSLHRLTLLGGRVSAAAPVRVLSALHSLPASQQAGSHRAACSAAGPPPAAAAAAAPALLRRQRQRPQLPRLAASYSVVSDAGGEQGSVGSGKPWRLIIYSKEGCCLCDGLKEKVGRTGRGRGGCRGVEARPLPAAASSRLTCSVGSQAAVTWAQQCLAQAGLQ